MTDLRLCDVLERPLCPINLLCPGRRLEGR